MQVLKKGWFLGLILVAAFAKGQSGLEVPPSERVPIELAAQNAIHILKAGHVPGDLKMVGGCTWENVREEMLCWWFSLDNGLGQTYCVAANIRNGEVTFINVSGTWTDRFDTFRRPLKAGAIEKANQTLKDIIPTSLYSPIDKGAFQVGSGKIYAHYRMTQNGLPFFNLNPDYAYRADIDSATGELYTYVFSPLPPVNAKEPQIPEEEVRAIFALIRLRDAQLNPSYAQEGLKLRLTLGYFKPLKERTARLVWKGTLFGRGEHGEEIEIGGASDYVDAVTGEQVPPIDL